MPSRITALIIAIGLIWQSTAVPADALDRETVINGLAAASRNTILQSIEALPAMGEKTALAALLALQDKRLGRDPQGRAVIINEKAQTGVYAYDGAPFVGDRKCP